MESAEHRVASRSGGRAWIEADVPQSPTTVHEALAALDAVTERLLARGDQRAVFPDVYAIITRRVSESVAIGADGFFKEPSWISRLAGRFCERYLTTLRWSLRGDAQDTGAWSIAYACCDLGDMMPIHHVLLGLSAHINYDLALGIAATIAEQGAAHDHARIERFKHDHDAVNCLLRASIPEAFDHLMDRHACPISRLVYRHAYAAAEWVVMHVLTRWRERVWNDAMALLHAETPTQKRRIERRLERRSQHYARLLAIPGILPLAGVAPTSMDAGRPGRARQAIRAEQLLQVLA